MKQLQNNFTTPEQSKRLLELGVPADSADCYYDGHELTVRQYRWHDAAIAEKRCTPCWSVGRLIEIDIICHKAKETNWKVSKHTDGTRTDLLGLVYREFVSSALVGDYDFSKLEE